MPSLKQNLYKLKEVKDPLIETKILTYKATFEQLIEGMFDAISVPKQYVGSYIFLMSVRDKNFNVDVKKHKFQGISERSYRQYLYNLTKYKVEKEPLLSTVSRNVYRINPIFVYNPDKPASLVIEFKSND